MNYFVGYCYVFIFIPKPLGTQTGKTLRLILTHCALVMPCGVIWGVITDPADGLLPDDTKPGINADRNFSEKPSVKFE